VKTRLELASEEANTRDISDAKEVATPSGLRYTDLKLGGGSPPIPGYIVVLDYKAYADGELFEDTIARKKPIVLL
jgi:FKBP-type peptidyl-prolyl cis-trans isomerase